MRELTHWEWFLLLVAIIAGLFYLVHWLGQRLPPNDPPNNNVSA